MTSVTMKNLLESGAHFGHQTHRWDPRMKPYIFGSRNGVHIIDLQNTMRCLQKALEFTEAMTARGAQFMFVGTKRQAQEVVKAEGERSNQPYVNTRWLGGTLTNFATIKSRVDRMRQLESLLEKPESLS